MHVGGLFCFYFFFCLVFKVKTPQTKTGEMLRLLLLRSKITPPLRLIMCSTLCVYLKDSEINHTALHADRENQRITPGVLLQQRTCICFFLFFYTRASLGLTILLEEYLINI